jgi:hypothetical protein
MSLLNYQLGVYNQLWLWLFSHNHNRYLLLAVGYPVINWVTGFHTLVIFFFFS